MSLSTDINPRAQSGEFYYISLIYIMNVCIKYINYVGFSLSVFLTFMETSARPYHGSLTTSKGASIL